MRPAVKYTLLTLLWAGVAIYVCWIAGAARADRAARRITAVEIDIDDSTAFGQLVVSTEVRKWLQQEQIEAVGMPVDAVHLTAIEQLIARNGFVGRVAAYTTRNGVLHIDIAPREPVLRLLVDGENAYVTARGYVFNAPQASSLYVPVATGPYRPPYPSGSTGDVRLHIDSTLRRIEHEIEQLELDKLPIRKAQRSDNSAYNKERRKRIKWWWKYLENDHDYQARIERLRDEKVQQRRAYRYRTRLRDQEIARIEARQEQKRDQQKKLEKNYEDFMKLLTFVKLIERSDFWSAEVVQIVVRSAPSGALEVDLIPRTGRHLIRFGRLERMPEKLDKLLRFYRKGLMQLGWERYRIIDIRYTDQVICR